MGLLKGSKKKKSEDEKDYDEDYYAEDPWYSYNLAEDTRKKKKKKGEDGPWDGMAGEFS